MSGTGLLEGKAAVITGGASGQGRASALRLAAEGARVLIADVKDGGRGLHEAAYSRWYRTRYDHQTRRRGRLR